VVWDNVESNVVVREGTICELEAWEDISTNEKTVELLWEEPTCILCHTRAPKDPLYSWTVCTICKNPDVSAAESIETTRLMTIESASIPPSLCL
jgi:hypothetical protein